jgi:hypothetical protein
MLTKLIQIANELDNRGLIKEADLLDAIISRADDSMTLPMPVGNIEAEEEFQEPEGDGGFFQGLGGKFRKDPDDRAIDTLDDLTMAIDDPDCDLECAENAALKYRSSLNYQENEDIERDIVNALVNSKRPEPGEEA